MGGGNRCGIWKMMQKRFLVENGIEMVPWWYRLCSKGEANLWGAWLGLKTIVSGTLKVAGFLFQGLLTPAQPLACLRAEQS